MGTTSAFDCKANLNSFAEPVLYISEEFPVARSPRGPLGPVPQGLKGFEKDSFWARGESAKFMIFLLNPLTARMR